MAPRAWQISLQTRWKGSLRMSRFCAGPRERGVLQALRMFHSRLSIWICPRLLLALPSVRNVLELDLQRCSNTHYQIISLYILRV